MEINTPFIDPAAIADAELSSRKQWTTRNALEQIKQIRPDLTYVELIRISAVLDRHAEHYVFEGHKNKKHGTV